jgi:Reverse transcriptase (RNA-dependent DNA polymerase)
MELEHERMIENKVWEPIDKNKIPSKAKGLMSTWAIKREASSKFHSQIKNACKYKHVNGVHYASEDTTALVASTSAIKLVMVLMAMARFTMHILDVQGAILISQFNKDEELYMKNPQGFEEKYENGIVLKLKLTIYGLKQAARGQ